MDGPVGTWDWFLVPQNEPTPADAAMGMFTPVHLAVLAVLTVAVAALVMAYRAAPPVARRRIRLVVASTLLALEAARQLGHVVSGYTPDIAPLHVCGVSVVVVMLDATVRSRWTADFLYVLGWWGALAADVFPDWANRPLLNVYTWQSFAAHTLIVGYVLMRLVGGDLVPRPRNLPRVAAAVAVLATVAVLANRAWGTNFWFLGTGAPDSPLQAIQQAAGGAYVPVLILLFALLTAVLYLPWVLRERRVARGVAAAPGPVPEAARR